MISNFYHKLDSTGSPPFPPFDNSYRRAAAERQSGKEKTESKVCMRVNKQTNKRNLGAKGGKGAFF
jgi:hypothetical protein